MKSLDTSSGDLLSERRADYAEMLFASGDHAAAAEVMLGALDLAPAWAMGWFRLGEMQEAAGHLDRAALSWRMALQLEPEDRLGAGLKLELIGAAPASSAPPAAFVETLFDFYAEKFDGELVGKLGYDVPRLIERKLAVLGRTRFHVAIDLGCGTGLMGERLRPLAERLEGYDISAGMLHKAAKRQVYDRLHKADIAAFDYGRRDVDLVTATDVFIYVGAVREIVAKIAAMLVPGGLFAFSVELHDGPEDFVLLASRRYAHSQAHIEALLEQSGFSLLAADTETIRQDRGAPIRGLVVVAQRLL